MIASWEEERKVRSDLKEESYKSGNAACAPTLVALFLRMSAECQDPLL